jgi:uncharacterized protein (TIRG00374 family)
LKQPRHIFFAVLRTAIAVGLILYLNASGAIDWHSILSLTTNWSIILIALILLLIGLIVQSQRLCILLRPHGLTLSLYSSVKLNLMGTFFNFCLPGATGGDAVKIYYAIKGNEGRRTEVAAIMLFDRVIGMFALLLLPLLVTPMLPRLQSSPIHLKGLLLTTAAFVIVMLLVLLAYLMNLFSIRQFVSKFFEKLPLGQYVQRVFDAIYVYRHNKTILLMAVAISLVIHVITVAAMVLLSSVIKSERIIWEIWVLVPLGLVANSLPVTPGGLGVGEAAFNKLFAMVGISGGASLILAWRFLMILLGFIGLSFYLQGRRRLVFCSVSSPISNTIPPSDCKF